MLHDAKIELELIGEGGGHRGKRSLDEAFQISACHARSIPLIQAGGLPPVLVLLGRARSPCWHEKPNPANEQKELEFHYWRAFLHIPAPLVKQGALIIVAR